MPNSRVEPAPPPVCGSNACSREVNGPDSTTSVETVPVRAAITSAGRKLVSAKTLPAAAIATNNRR